MCTCDDCQRPSCVPREYNVAEFADMLRKEDARGYAIGRDLVAYWGRAQARQEIEEWAARFARDRAAGCTSCVGHVALEAHAANLAGRRRALRDMEADS